MSIRVGINGFGRMGRLGFRAAWDWPELEIVHINEIKGGTAAAAHLLQFDTVHGRWGEDIAASDDAINVAGKRVSFSSHSTPGEVPWRDMDVESTLKGILGFESKPLVSADFVNDVHSGIVDGPSTMMIDDTLVKILVWYDNEIGYANRMMELVKKVALTLPSRMPT